MSKTGKIIVGILSILPILLFIGYFIAFFSVMFSFVANVDASGNPAPPAIDQTSFIGSMIIMFIVLALTVLLSFGMLIYFIVHIAGNARMDSNERTVWIIIIIFTGMLGFPIYWYLKIWKEEVLEPQKTI